MNKVFSLFLTVALVLGGSLGGAFAGGVALGKSQGEASADAPEQARFPDGTGRQGSGEFGPNRSDSPGQRSGVGGGGPVGRQGPRGGFDRQGFRDGTQDRPDRELVGRSPSDQRGVAGVIEQVADNQLTITTRQELASITLGPDTSILRVVEGSLDDLVKDARVRVMGPRDDEGKVQARAITLIPEGADGFFGRRGSRQVR